MVSLHTVKIRGKDFHNSLLVFNVLYYYILPAFYNSDWHDARYASFLADIVTLDNNCVQIHAEEYAFDLGLGT